MVPGTAAEDGQALEWGRGQQVEHSRFPTTHTSLPCVLFAETPGLRLGFRILLVMDESNWTLGS